ncbi:Aldo/keto reductase [Colletotrichum falcatum]|nr:Aldo/keto reductase [Colletotrichum falcatum]
MGISRIGDERLQARFFRLILELLDRAWELGYTNWDTASDYGDSEVLIGKWFKLHPERRADKFTGHQVRIHKFFSECLEVSLQKMGVDYIDLYCIHRLDPKVPVEKTMELMTRAKNDGKIKAMGISQSASNSIRRAYAVTPVEAVQAECSLITVVAYAPLGRGFLTGQNQIKSSDDFAPDEFRCIVPRFSPENFAKNLVLADRFKTFADKKGCTPGQLALAWLSAKGEDIIPIPGTKKLKYMEENVEALKVHLSKEQVQEIREEVEKAEVYPVTVEL